MIPGVTKRVPRTTFLENHVLRDRPARLLRIQPFLGKFGVGTWLLLIFFAGAERFR